MCTLLVRFGLRSGENLSSALFVKEICAVGFDRDRMSYPDGLGDDQVIIFARFILTKKS